MMPGGILAHGRHCPRPGARPRARAVALDWGIFSQHIRGEFTQQLHRSVSYDRARAQRAKLAADIAELTARAEAADAQAADPQALPAEIARREALRTKLDAACARLEAEAREQAAAAQLEYEAKKAAYEARKGRRGRPPKPPDDAPPPERQSNLTDPDSALMRRSEAHEYRQAYNAQAVVCAPMARN